MYTMRRTRNAKSPVEILKFPTQHVLGEIVTRHKIAETSPGVGSIVVPDQAEPAPLEKQPAPASASRSLTGIPQHLSTLADAEVRAERLASVVCPASASAKRQIIAALSAAVWSRAASTSWDGSDLHIQRNTNVSNPHGTDVLVTVQEKGIATRLPYFGRVIDERAAASATKQLLLPLTPPGHPKSPQLFLDGSGNANIQKSDVCVLWLVKPIQEL